MSSLPFYNKPVLNQLNSLLHIPIKPDYLHSKAATLLTHQSSAPYQLPTNYSSTVVATKRFGDFMNRIFSLAEVEIEIESRAAVAQTTGSSLDQQCIELAQKIDTYLDAVAGVYDHNPEQKSVMLLTVMELWVSMDQCAVRSFSLLNDYNPAFLPDILDVLQLLSLRDMCCLQNI
jgi:hypothetical protein